MTFSPSFKPLVSVPASDSSDAPLTVAELDRTLRRAVETASNSVWVQGEIGAPKTAPSGHCYFTLKDEAEDAVIDAVAYKDTAARAKRFLFEGARVVVRGKATIWAPRGKLQFVVDTVRPAGRGVLLEALERLKQKLSAEGLFALERKKPVPSGARTIGVVTSPTGAVIHDIIRVAFRRGAARIILSPTVVQGEEAPASIVAALDKLERVRPLDVIIIGRGGGSFEDLMAFNDERVVRRVAACTVPIVSAVGHEVDITLTDLAADARASTPSQAAELVVADEQSQRETLRQLHLRLVRAMRARLVEDTVALDRLVARLGEPRGMIAERQQRLDDLVGRMATAARSSAARRKTALERLHRQLLANHPKVKLARTQGRLEMMSARLGGAMRARLGVEQGKVRDCRMQLEALSPLAVLQRGYAIATAEDGSAVVDAEQVAIGSRVTVRLRRGRLGAEVREAQVDRSDGESD